VHRIADDASTTQQERSSAKLAAHAPRVRRLPVDRPDRTAVRLRCPCTNCAGASMKVKLAD
jgi:hypothetical protein